MSFYSLKSTLAKFYFTDPLARVRLPKQRQLLQNAVFIPEENVYLKSSHVHDFNGHEWNGALGKCSMFVDGGLEYVKRAMSGSFVYEDYSLYDDDLFDKVAARMLWGTRGKGGKNPLRWVPLSECETDHLNAILETQPQIRGKLVERVILYILEERKTLASKTL